MPVVPANTLPKPTRLQHYRKAEELIAAADAVVESTDSEKDIKVVESLEKQADRLVARAHVHAVLSTVDRTVAQ